METLFCEGGLTQLNHLMGVMLRFHNHIALCVSSTSQEHSFHETSQFCIVG